MPRPVASPEGVASLWDVNASRTVQPELLDGLAPDHPDAVASRRDLRVINRLMGGERWIGHEMRAHRRSGERILELGAGEGILGGTLGVPDAALAGLDLGPRPAAWPPGASWHQTDVLRFEAWTEYPIVVANLFLHHLEAEALQAIGRQLDRHARLILVSEPRCARRSLLLFRLLCPLMRAHAVTRHDGRVSIEAGFRGGELPRLLGLEPDRWQWSVTETGLAGYRLKAERRP